MIIRNAINIKTIFICSAKKTYNKRSKMYYVCMFSCCLIYIFICLIFACLSSVCTLSICFYLFYLYFLSLTPSSCTIFSAWVWVLFIFHAVPASAPLRVKAHPARASNGSRIRSVLPHLAFLELFLHPHYLLFISHVILAVRVSFGWGTCFLLPPIITFSADMREVAQELEVLQIS